jgi:hypothetical protein
LTIDAGFSPFVTYKPQTTAGGSYRNALDEAATAALWAPPTRW